MAQYATLAHLVAFGLPAEALEGVAVQDQDSALKAASSLADSYLGAVFTVPLASWQDDLRRAVVAIAVYDLMSRRGFNPDGSDQHIRLRYEDAIAWLKMVAAGAVVPVVDEPPDDGTGDASSGVVYSEPLRGW